MKTGPILGLASLAVASAIIPRDTLDNPYGKATCGISGQSDQLDAYDLRWATESFAEDIPSLVDENQKFTGKISNSYGSVTVFACDYKSRKKGSVITPDLVRGAPKAGGYLDTQCGTAIGGYERNNDLSIGRTLNGDHFC